MIAVNNYKCANDAAPNQAIMACIQINCRHQALMCGDINCQCQQIHRGHQIVHLMWLLEKVAIPQELPASLVKLEKGINSLIDSLIREL